MKHLILFILFFKYADVLAQADSSTYYIHTKDGYSHFYYDEQYYLVDQNCKFRHYTRVVKRGKEGDVFDGFFTDYYNNNKIALTGTYNNGLKNGVFKNYYYNGKPKFEVSFINDKPSGIARYYYDNGEPWMVINHQDTKVIITDYWDAFGNKKVIDGKGNFEYTDYVWGYNESGFNAISYNGRLLNGLPTAAWRILIDYPNSPSELIAIESFEKGEFKNSFSYRDTYYPKNASDLKFFPEFIDSRSQKFIFKKCGIDENQNFTTYLENFMNRNFDFTVISKNPTITSFVCKANISPKGKLISINVIEGETAATNNYVKILLNLVPYWIPSFVNGKTIPDKLTISFYLNNTEAEKKFERFSISREEEN